MPRLKGSKNGIGFLIVNYPKNWQQMRANAKAKTQITSQKAEKRI